MRDEALDKALEAILDDAAVMADEKIGEALCDPEEDIQFSAESEQRMKKLFKRERRKLRMKRLRKSSKWTACVLLAVIVVSGVTIFSVSAWRVRFLNFILDIGQPNTDYSFGDEQDHSYSDDEITLGYIPDGFKMAANKSNSKSIFLRFESENQYFHFSIISLEGRSSLDTENGTAERIKINGYEAYYTSNQNINTLIWYNDKGGFSLIGNISRKEMIEIAENVKR